MHIFKNPERIWQTWKKFEYLSGNPINFKLKIDSKKVNF